MNLERVLHERGLPTVARYLDLAKRYPGIVGMAEENPPLYMDVSNAYSGDELGVPWRHVISEGIVGLTDLEVIPATPEGLSVDVRKGWAAILGDANPDRQPLYWAFNNATLNKGITPDPGLPRKVLITAQIVDEAFAGVGKLWRIDALHGVAAASPLEPALPASATPLALIDVTAGDLGISAGQITNRRVPYGLATALQTGGGVWQAYVPAWTSTGVAPALGNGTLSGEYVQIGKLVTAKIALTMGSTTTYGTGTYKFSVPVANTGIGSFRPGTAVVFDTSTGALIFGFVRSFDNTTVDAWTPANPAVTWGPTVPITFATGDIIEITYTYEAA